MKKKKNPEDLMEEDLMETIQHRINELTAELKLLNARPGPLFMTRELLRRDETWSVSKNGLDANKNGVDAKSKHGVNISRMAGPFSNGLTASSENGKIGRTPYWSNSGFDATNGNGRRFKHEQRKSKHGVNAKRRKISLSGANGSLVNGILRTVYCLSLTPTLTRVSMGRTVKTPFCALLSYRRRMKIDYSSSGTGSQYMPPWTAKLCSGTTETRTPGMMSKRKSSGSSGRR